MVRANIDQSWTIDEAFSSRSAYNITLQRSMISEPLNVAGHKIIQKVQPMDTLLRLAEMLARSIITSLHMLKAEVGAWVVV